MASQPFFLTNTQVSEVEIRLRELRRQTRSDSQASNKSFVFDLIKPRLGRKQKLTVLEIEALRNILLKHCLTYVQDVYLVHLNRLKALQLLNTLIDWSPIEKISDEVATHLVWAGASCLHHFLLKITLKKTLIQHFQRKNLKKAFLTFEKLIKFLTALKYRMVFNAVVTFLDEGNAWDVDHYCAYLLSAVLLSTSEVQQRINSIMEIILLIENTCLMDSVQPRKIFEVLHQIEEAQQWGWVNKDLIVKFLDIYYKSLTPETDLNNYACLEKNVETALRAMSQYIDLEYLMFMIQHMLHLVSGEELPENSLLFFTDLLEDLVTGYRQKYPNTPLPDQIILPLLKRMGSKYHVYSLLGLRTMHGFLDRCNNKLEFQSPKVYMRSTHYNIVLGSCKVEDKETFQKHAELFHATIIECVLRHGGDKLIFLDNVYTTIALLLVEIPCLYVTAAGLYLAISLQKATRNARYLCLDHEHRIHAMVGSILSLICYVHRASLLYEYVEMIIDRRAKWAPHLNPPLRITYNYGQHDILWDKEEMFFEDCESQFRLWKSFKQRRFVVERCSE